MRQIRFAPRALAPLMLVALAACSDGPTDKGAVGANESPLPDEVVAASEVPGLDKTGSPLPKGTVGDHVLTLEGLGVLKIGQPLPIGSSWAERGAQASDTCRLVSSLQYPGVYAIAEGSKVRRITVNEGSDVRTVEGIGFGSSRAQVDRAFPGFRESPHKYVAGGKYLIAPGVENGNVAVRFEIGAGSTVTAMHVGTMPVLGYVEGCA